MAQESNYILEVSDNGTSGWSVLATLPANTTSYQHTGLVVGTTKHYRIKAKGDNATTSDSVYSSVVSATTTNGGGYESLSNVELILDWSGLAPNTNNSYGQVDAAGNIVSVKSIAPAPVGRDFTVAGSGVILTAEGIAFNGSGNLSNAVKTPWKFLHYNAGGIAAYRHTTHFVVKLGNVADPNAVYGLMGNNATSNAKIGDSLYWDDRTTTPANNKITAICTSGGGGAASNVYITLDNSAMPPNQYAVITRVVDGTANPDSNLVKFYLNGNLMAVNTDRPKVMSSSDSTHPLDIGAAGNSAIRLVGTIKRVILQSTVETDTVRNNFINWLKVQEGIV
jgi:cyclophilin family peptidyl-prolyl cis-trans isomerase